MLVVLFRSRLKPGAAESGYPEMATEMLERARTFPGFVDFKSFAAPDGERISIVHWKDEETMAVWRNDERHRIAQQRGKTEWYESYSLEVAEVKR